MTASDWPASLPLRAATLCYFDIPCDVWPLALLRAGQLGADTIVAPLDLARHALPDGGLDLLGSSAARLRLPALAQACASAGLALVLRLEPLAGCGLPADRLRGWLAALAHDLAPYQAPRGSIAALWLSPADAAIAEELRAAGWAAPIELLPAGMPAAPPAQQLLAGEAWLSCRPSPGGAALLRRDGGARPAFWRAKMARLLVGAAAADFAAARAPADLALLAGTPPDAALLALAHALERDDIAFDLIDIAAATPARLARYTLALVPAHLTHQPDAAPLAQANNIALLAHPGELPAEEFFYKPRLPHAPAAEPLHEMLEALGGRPRYSWASDRGLSLRLCHGSRYSYLFAHNRGAQFYSGMLTYRAPDGAVLHLHASIAAARSGAILLHGDEVLGAAIDGDGAEAGWRVRGLQTSLAFSGGAAAIVADQHSLIATAAQNGRFQLRASQPWPEIAAYRLLLNGAPLPAQLDSDAAHLTLPYLADDDLGQTDCYIALPPGRALPDFIRAYLATLLRARAALLNHAAAAAQPGAPATALRAAAHELAGAAAGLSQVEAYVAAWRAAEAYVASAVGALAAGSTQAEAIAALLENA